MTIGRYSQAISDLNKAVLLNSKNIKALKRLAQVHLVLGELSEAELYLKRCVEVELNEESHKVDVKIVRDLIISNEELNKAKFIYDYKKCEPLAQKLVSKCTEANHIKLIYLECLIQNCKPQEALTFFKEKINLEDSRKPEYQYLLCQAYYQDGK
jgi:tetratricopeptide (TPR) repeat protein